jgi:hypothetical protein
MITYWIQPMGRLPCVSVSHAAEQSLCGHLYSKTYLRVSLLQWIRKTTRSYGKLLPPGCLSVVMSVCADHQPKPDDLSHGRLLGPVLRCTRWWLRWSRTLRFRRSWKDSLNGSVFCSFLRRRPTNELHVTLSLQLILPGELTHKLAPSATRQSLSGRPNATVRPAQLSQHGM